MTQGLESLVGPSDDDFHPGADPWHTEGSWWGFSVPERRIGGWIYHLTRLGLGVASGGVWVWDDRATSCFEAPYYRNEVIQPLPPGPHNLNDFRWPDGVALRTLEPMQRYRMQYRDRDLIELDLEYCGISAPYVSANGSPPRPFRLEQVCRVTGTLALRGERIAVDCLAMRDHSWGIRKEQTLSTTPTALIGRDELARLDQRPVVYFYGNASADEAFFVMGPGGYLTHKGVRHDLAQVRQTIRRNAANDHIETIVVEGTDTAGRALHAEGRALSCIDRPSNSGLGMIYVVEWNINGHAGYGDLQDIWPIDLWSAFRAARRGR